MKTSPPVLTVVCSTSTPGWIQIVMEPPEQSGPGCHFDQAVQAEANEGHGPGD